MGFQKPKFVIGLDGSASAIQALKTAKLFAEKYDGELHLVYVFDSNLHKGIFMTLKESLIQREGFSDIEGRLVNYDFMKDTLTGFQKP